MNKLMISLVFSMSFGCAQTATISHLELGMVEAEVKDATRENVRLQDGTVLAKNAITDIDHPGNVHLTVGGVFAGLGLLQTATGVFSAVTVGVDEFAQTQLSFGVTYIIVGGILSYWGYTTWKRSVDATEIPDERF